MTTLFDNTDVTVEIAFGDVPLETSPTWTDVTAYVRQIDIDRGRSSEFTSYSPGTARVVLDNRDRRFDPEHSSSPYAGDLVPMVPIRVTAQYSTGTTHVVFYGFVMGWPTSYNESNTDAVAVVPAVDAARVLSNALLPEFTMRSEIEADSPWRYWPLQEFDSADGKPTSEDYLGRGVIATKSPTTVQQFDAKSPAGASQYVRVGLNAVGTWAYNPTVQGDTLVAGGYWFDSVPPVAGDMYPDFRWARDVTGSKVKVQIRNRYNSSLNTWQITLVQFESEVEGLYGLDTTTTNYSTNDGANFFFWTLDGNDIVVFINAVEVYRYTLSTTPYTIVPFALGLEIPVTTGDRNTGLSHVALYQSRVSAARIAAQYAAGLGYGSELSSVRLGRALDDGGWPASWRDIDTGVQAVGVYTPDRLPTSRYMEQIGDAEQGELFVNREGSVELRNRSRAVVSIPDAFFDPETDDLPFTNVRLDGNTVDTVRNYIAVRYANGEIVSQDATSIGDYGIASETIDARLIDEASAAQAIGDVRLARTKDPRTRVTRLDVDVRADASTLVDVIGPLDLADDVVVAFTPTGVGDPIWRAVRVQGISHSITPSSWQSSLYLAPGPTGVNGPLLVLDNATYGELDAGNKLG